MLFFLLASLLLILILWYVLNQIGIFYRINIRVERPNDLQDRIYIAYKFFIGTYTEAYKTFKYIDSICPIEKNRVLSIYYDDPQKTESGKQRYLIGIILNDSLSINKSLETYLVEQNDFKCAWLSAIDQAVLTEFPLKNKLSIFIASMRVYPKLSGYIKKHKLNAYPFVEYYNSDKNEKLIRYYVPVCENKKSYLVQDYFLRN